MSSTAWLGAPRFPPRGGGGARAGLQAWAEGQEGGKGGEGERLNTAAVGKFCPEIKIRPPKRPKVLGRPPLWGLCLTPAPRGGKGA